MSKEFVLSRGRLLLPVAGEALLIIAVYTAYGFVRVLVEGTPGEAVDNASEIIALERTLGIFHELQVQRVFTAVPGLLIVMEGAYRFLYLPCVVAGAAVGYFRDRQLYRKYRYAFFMSLGIGLVFFSLLPVAPPRMMPEYGFVDVIHNQGIATSDGSRNNFAAVPSFHFGLPLLATIGLCQAFRLKPWQCILAGLVPAVMLLAIVSTANHYFLDAVVGAAVVLSAAWWCVWRPTGSAADQDRSSRPPPRQALPSSPPTS